VDFVTGGLGNDILSGGPHADQLDGGPGRNAYFGGGGNDTIDAANGVAGERANCNAGQDRVLADAGDRLRGCELIFRLRR
ncbi:MAG: hypothetical protein M3327_05720, partial [Actinomycetota bacterium]|nr:hypothetical protein [Actinomycetota bacterium]